MFADIPHSVYRLFDHQSRLLYVGCSYFPAERKLQHSGKCWYSEIASMTSTEYLTKELALAAEMTAIELENPLYNYTHQINKQRVTRQIKKDKQRAARAARQLAIRSRCPRCGGPKDYKPGVAYCPPCVTEDQRERKLAHGWVPSPTFGKHLCRCGKPLYVSPRGLEASYCQECKKEKNRQYRLTH